MARKNKWSRELVISALAERHKQGKSMTSSAIRKEDQSLRGAMETYFGSHYKALAEIGLTKENVSPLTFWDRDMIKREFLVALEDVSSISELSRKHKKLDHAIRKHYGSYDALCDDLGMDVSVIKRQVREWAGEDLLDVLREIRDEGGPLNITSVKTRFPTVHEVAVRCFGSYENALSSVGEKLDDHICAMKYDSHLGKSFERLLWQMYQDLGYNFSYQKRLCNNTIMPDFYDEDNNIFIDAKLSSWTVFCSSSIEKYLPHCDELIVVYLRGSDIQHDTPRLKLRHVSQYYGELEDAGLTHYIAEFDRLLSKADNLGERSAA
ncbi:hypothetical protein [Paenibacillus urinalis]|uniref:hypothetical protein n=1 Tax=Paenibacillus urinalis TaxID=521520 RepID=UPI001960AE43